MADRRSNLVDYIESISEQIQVLALNIAVAAAKMSFNKKLAPEVNTKLSQLVNEATLAVKNMGMVVRAAKSEKPKKDLLTGSTGTLDSDLVGEIELSLKAILVDSEKIMSMLNEVKQQSL